MLKQTVVIVAFMAVAFGASLESRYILDSLGISPDKLKEEIQIMLNVLGGDPTEQACEQEGHKLFGDGLITHSVPLICHSFQEMIKHFQLVQVTTTAASVKRNVFTNLLDKLHAIVDTNTLKMELQSMLDILGGDPTEQACEQEGRKLVTGLLEHSVPLICHSFQELIKHYRLVPLDQAVGKRFFFYSFNSDVLKQDLQLLVNSIGSEPTEALCEEEVKKLFGAGLLSHSAPLVCRSFQQLVKTYSIVPATGSKRFVLDTLLSTFDTTALKADLQTMLDVLGSDPTEQNCEAEGNKLVGAGTLLSHSVPLICHSFQELINHFNIVPDTTTAATA